MLAQVRIYDKELLRSTKDYSYVLAAISLILKGYSEGLYPKVAIKATHLLRWKNAGKRELGNIGRGLAILERLGFLRKVSRNNSRAAKYHISGCPGNCDVCSLRNTDQCPIERLKIIAHQTIIKQKIKR